MVELSGSLWSRYLAHWAPMTRICLAAWTTSGVMASSWLMPMTRAIWVIRRSMRRKLPSVIWVTALAVSAWSVLSGSNGWPSCSQYWASTVGDVVGVQWLVLVGEPDPAVQ